MRNVWFLYMGSGTEQKSLCLQDKRFTGWAFSSALLSSKAIPTLPMLACGTILYSVPFSS